MSTNAIKLYNTLMRQCDRAVEHQRVPVENFEVAKCTKAHVLDRIDNFLTSLNQLLDRSRDWYKSEDQNPDKLVELIDDISKTIYDYKEDAISYMDEIELVDVDARTIYNNKTIRDDFIPRLITIVVRSERAIHQSSLYDEINEATKLVGEKISDVLNAVIDHLDVSKVAVVDGKVAFIEHNEQFIFTDDELKVIREKQMAELERVEQEKKFVEKRKTVEEFFSCHKDTFRKLFPNFPDEIRSEDNINMLLGLSRLVGPKNCESKFISSLEATGSYEILIELDRTIPLIEFVAITHLLGSMINVEDTVTHEWCTGDDDIDYFVSKCSKRLYVCIRSRK